VKNRNRPRRVATGVVVHRCNVHHAHALPQRIPGTIALQALTPPARFVGRGWSQHLPDTAISDLTSARLYVKMERKPGLAASNRTHLTHSVTLTDCTRRVLIPEGHSVGEAEGPLRLEATGREHRAAAFRNARNREKYFSCRFDRSR